MYMCYTKTVIFRTKYSFLLNIALFYDWRLCQNQDESAAAGAVRGWKRWELSETVQDRGGAGPCERVTSEGDSLGDTPAWWGEGRVRWSR